MPKKLHTTRKSDLKTITIILYCILNIMLRNNEHYCPNNNNYNMVLVFHFRVLTVLIRFYQKPRSDTR
jgi:hypothetical protein